MVAWLAYRGVLESVSTVAAEHSISIWARAATVAVLRENKKWFYLRERRLELARLLTCPTSVSRLMGLFAFPSRDFMNRAVAEWGFQDHFVSEVEIQPGTRLSWHDSQWLESANHDAEQGLAAASAYAQGIPFDDNPFWEILVDGRAAVLDTDLRTRGRSVVQHHWPDSLPALEIARLAAEIGLPFGHIASYPIFNDTEVRLSWAINLADDQETQDLLVAHISSLPRSKVNFDDLRRGTEDTWFKVPNLSDRDVVIPRNLWPWGATLPD
ncbi:hypothetical protein [Curtobacterium sp. PvP017]